MFATGNVYSNYKMNCYCCSAIQAYLCVFMEINNKNLMENFKEALNERGTKLLKPQVGAFQPEINLLRDLDNASKTLFDSFEHEITMNEHTN